MNNEIGIKTVNSGVGSAGVGFVVVPEGFDRQEYIDDCYRTNTLTINGGKGYGYFSGVYADSNVMQNIEFPSDEINRGTPVIWVRDGTSRLPIVIGVLRKQDNYYSLKEGQKRIKSSIGDNNVEVLFDANDSSISVNVVGDSDTASEITINVNSANADSVVSLNCDNKVIVSTEKDLTVISGKTLNISVEKEGNVKGEIKYELEKGFSVISEEAIDVKIRDSKDDVKLECNYKVGSGFTYKDEFNNEIKCDKSLIEIRGKKINHSGGKEPMVLGDTLVATLKELITSIQAITVPTSQGPSGNPINTASFSAISNKLQKILSSNSNLD